MNKKIMRFIICLILIAILMASTVFAAGVKKNIEVLFNSINLTVNGNKVNAETIVYNGTTYVPLRAAAEMLGKEVGWDQKTNTASINDKATTTPTSEWKQVKVFEGNSIKNTETFKIIGNEWRVVWDTAPGEYGDMNFQIFIYKASGDLEGLAANVIGKGNDESYMRGSGEYYLTINSAQSYKIIIEER
jgi:ribosomal protein S19